MSFLDNLENNLKSMESREERGEQDRRDAMLRERERARVQASKGYAEELRKGAYAAEMLTLATRLGHGKRIKVHLAWIGTTLRLEARDSRLELRPTPEGVVAVFLENGAELRSVAVDLNGSPRSLVEQWLA